MRRWQAALVAMIAAVAVTAVSVGTPRSVDAGSSFMLNVFLDCDIGTAGIQSNCNPDPAPATQTIDLVFQNDLSFDFTLAAYNVAINGDNQPLFTPVAPSCLAPGLDCNPDHMASGAAWSCGPPNPVADDNPSATDTSSVIFGCNNPTDGPFIPDGPSLVTIARLTLNVSGTGVGNFTISNFNAFDNLGAEVGACNPGTGGNCVGATVQIGTSAATNTPTPVPATATNTPIPTATCVGAACPTQTSQAFVTVTLTPSATVPATATVPAGATPPPGATAPGGAAPGGGGAGGGAGPIRLPDTGAGGVGGDTAALWALAAMGAALVLGGSLAFSAASARVRREVK